MKIVCIMTSLFLLITLAGTSVSEQQTQPGDILPSIKPYLVSISVSDIDETLKWYHDNLGFTVLTRKDLPQLSLRIAFIEANEFVLEVVEFKSSISEEAIRKQFPVVDDRAKIQGFGKLAFRAGDVDALAARLKSKGVHFVRNVQEDKEIFHTKWFIVTDNSGNWIQFFQQ